MNRYQPKPKDTTNISLTPEILMLAEQLAENAHEVWAKQRMQEGWIYGPKRNDEKKEHPCFIPYSQLPESEKEYDRKTSMETLKQIIAEGYQIVGVNQNIGLNGSIYKKKSQSSGLL